MNLDLLESFGQNHPEDFEGSLDCVSIAVTCAFSRRGTLLAVGCNDGRIVIWDFLTRGIAKVITAHVHPVCSISWNRSGHKLLSASTDNAVSMWDVVSGECDKTFRLPSPILKVQFHPRNSDRFIICPMKHASVLMTADGSYDCIPLDEDSDSNIMAAFDRRGDHIYTGNARGKVLIFEADTLKLVASFRVTTGTANTTAIKSIEFARRKNCFLVNSADRIIRVYEAGEVLACGKDGEPEPIQKLQDLVNRTLWKKCCFSGDGEYIVAGSARQHALYIWEVSIGNIVKILHGTKGELLLDVVENWSAFAPDFKELDENVEYEERESEFDIEDEDKEIVETKNPEEEDTEVDVTSVDPITAFVSSDEEGEDESALMYLPVAPEVDEEDGWGAEQPSEEIQEKERKRSSSSKKDEASSPKKKKQKAVEIDLPNAPLDVSVHELRLGPPDVIPLPSPREIQPTLYFVLGPPDPSQEIHPLLNVKKPQEKGVARKGCGRPKGAGKPQKDGKSKKEKNKLSDSYWY